MKPPSQAERIRQVLSDGQAHSTVEILQRVYGPSHSGIARIASRITDLRAEGFTITSWKDKQNPTIWFYQMSLTGPAEPKKKFVPQYVIVDGVRRVRMVEV